MDDQGARTARSWKLGILLSMLTVVGANMVLIHLALSAADPVVASYDAEPR